VFFTGVTYVIDPAYTETKKEKKERPKSAKSLFGKKKKEVSIGTPGLQ
jgi:hypothetical protein